jgi:hypothetical protein
MQQAAGQEYAAAGYLSTKPAPGLDRDFRSDAGWLTLRYEDGKARIPILIGSRQRHPA